MPINQASQILPPRPKIYIEGSRKETLEEEDVCFVSMSASAQADLRCFEEEKEKTDVSSPRGVIEAYIKDCDHERSDDTNSSSNNDNDNDNDNNNNNDNSSIRCTSTRANSRWRRFFKIWKGKTTKRLPSFPPFASSSLSSRRKGINSIAYVAADDVSTSTVSTWRSFTLSELQAATNNFSQGNLIGKGGYAEVFKGCLADGQLVAIKRLNKGTLEEQSISFLSEIGIIAHVDHPNTAKMVGYGVEGGTHLVLQLSSLGSLSSLLHGSDKKLDWAVRHKIIMGTANGLLYLHENCQRRIIHRDIKADNILLTEDFVPQICDFGLAKWLPQQWTHHNVSKFEGTFGYFAPEYLMDGTVDEKTDVFSFGVLLLELVTGKQPVDESQKSMVLWAKPLLEANDLESLIDPTLCNDFVHEEMDRVVSTASLCIEYDPILRPKMSQIVKLLKGNDVKLESCPKEERKRYYYMRRTFSEELLDVEDYNSTKCLRRPFSLDDRHK